jgi:hypothetical protein
VPPFPIIFDWRSFLARPQLLSTVPYLGLAAHQSVCIENGCWYSEGAKKHYERAAGFKGSSQVAWASKAAKKLGNYDDEAKWHAELMHAAAPCGDEAASSDFYYSAMAQLELGNQAAVDADLHKAFMKPDRLLAYHLSRLALTGSDK